MHQQKLFQGAIALDGCSTGTARYQDGSLPLLRADEASALAGWAHALSDPIRVRMVHLLEQADSLCTCELEALLGLSQSRVSYHLKTLLDAGLIERQTRGQWRYYALTRDGVLNDLRAASRVGNKGAMRRAQG